MTLCRVFRRDKDGIHRLVECEGLPNRYCFRHAGIYAVIEAREKEERVAKRQPATQREFGSVGGPSERQRDMLRPPRRR